MRICSKDSSTPGALFRKAGRPPDRLSSSSFDTPSTWLSNLGSQHHKGYQGENSQHVDGSYDVARSLPDSQVAGKGLRRDADMPGDRGKEEQERHPRLMGEDGKAARAKDAEEMYGDRCRQNRPRCPLQHEVALLAGTRWARGVGQHQSGSADACEHVRSRRAFRIFAQRHGRLALQPFEYAAARIRSCCSIRNDMSPPARSQSLFGGTRRTVPRPTSAVCPARVRILCSGKARTCGSRWYESQSPP